MMRFQQQGVRRIASGVMAVIVLIASAGPGAAGVQPGGMDNPQAAPIGVMALSGTVHGSELVGRKVYPDDPLRLSFFIRSGDENQDTEHLRAVTERMIRYFLAGLTIPEEDLWVNLSPYEADRVIPEVLGRTGAGQDLLEQDYILKQLAASLTYPESGPGKQFWDALRQALPDHAGAETALRDTFSKVWIIPETAVVHETADHAVIAESRLKVMVEADYLAWKNRAPNGMGPDNSRSGSAGEEAMRRIIVPLIEDEVNSGAHFLALRQIYQAMILASWFKDRLRTSAMVRVYGNRKKTAGIESGDEEAVAGTYARYLKVYTDGVYDYIREDVSDEGVIPRRYFSGGTGFGTISEVREDISVPEASIPEHLNGLDEAEISFKPDDSHSDPAMLTASASKNPVLGTAAIVRLEPGKVSEYQMRTLMARLMALDYLVEMLDELDKQDRYMQGWGRMLKRIREVYPFGKSARVRIRDLITAMDNDFKILTAYEGKDFHLDYFKTFPQGSQIKALYDRYNRLPDNHSEKEQIEKRLHAIFDDPCGREHVLVLLGDEGARIFQEHAIHQVSLYDLLMSAIEHPGRLPDIPGIPDWRFIDIAVEQLVKYQKTYQLMKEQLEKEKEEAGPGEYAKMIDSYIRALNHEVFKKVLRDQVAKQKEDADAQRRSNIEFRARRYAENSLTFYAAIMTPGYRKTLQDPSSVIDEDPDQHIRDFRSQITAYIQNNQDAVRAYMEEHRDEALAKYEDHKKNEAETALWLRLTAGGYMSAVMASLKKGIEKLEGLGLPYSEIRQMLEPVKDCYDISVTMFREVVLMWHWHTSELRSIVKTETKAERARALLKTQKYIESLERYGKDLHESARQLRSAADHAYQYVIKVKNLVQLMGQSQEKGVKDTTHSYRWVIGVQAVDDILKMKTPSQRAQMRPLLEAVARSVLHAVELELPPAESFDRVDIFVSGQMSPTEYAMVYDHFKGKIGNIITSFGSLTSHYAFLAASDGVGVLIVDSGESLKDGQRVSVVTDDSGKVKIAVLDHDGRASRAVNLLSSQNLRAVYGSSASDVLVNADTVKEAGKASETLGIGLARSENQLRDEGIPSRGFFREQWKSMLKALGGKRLTVRAFDWKEDKKTTMMSFITSTEKKFYLDHPAGREILKEQLRALLDLHGEGYLNIRFMFPMVENEEDLKNIQGIIDAVLAEEGFQKKFQGKPFPVELGMMVETTEALKNMDAFVRAGWIQFFSIGTNDLISDLYQVDRAAPSSNVYYDEIHPRVIAAILKVGRMASAAGKSVSLCGELASKKEAWILHDLLKTQGAEVVFSMPGNDIPAWNGVRHALAQERIKSLTAWNVLNTTIQKLQDPDTGVDLDDTLKSALNEALSEIRQEIDAVMSRDVSRHLGLQEEETVDASLLSRSGKQQGEYGGIDLTRHREVVTAEGAAPVIDITLPGGQVMTLGGQGFAGFTFDIIHMGPYAPRL